MSIKGSKIIYLKRNNKKFLINKKFKFFFNKYDLLNISSLKSFLILYRKFKDLKIFCITSNKNKYILLNKYKSLYNSNLYVKYSQYNFFPFSKNIDTLNFIDIVNPDIFVFFEVDNSLEFYIRNKYSIPIIKINTKLFDFKSLKNKYQFQNIYKVDYNLFLSYSNFSNIYKEIVKKLIFFISKK